MAELIIHTDKIKENIITLSKYFRKHKIDWSLVTKVFSGDKEFLKNLLTEDVINHIDSIGDSRLTSLMNLREINPNMRTIYIKPPAIIYADDVVKYANISLNTSYKTIKALNDAAKKQNIIHKVIIMIELGELREGINRNDVIEFYDKVFDLSNIEVIGLGSNLGCMYGVEPSYDKLLQLSLYKQIIESKFNRKLKYVSGGSSITLPLIEYGKVPADINHFRIGEAIFFGTSPLEGEKFLNLHTNTFEFKANIIELEEKYVVPDGIINEANIGHTIDFNESEASEKSYKAILDFGMLDVDSKDIECNDKTVGFVGITSDMTVTDIGNNKVDGKKKFNVGDKICFTPNYMAVARLLNSKFIEKKYL